MLLAGRFLHILNIHDFAVLADTAILVHNNATEGGICANSDGDLALCDQCGPLLVALVVISSHDHAVLNINTLVDAGTETDDSMVDVGLADHGAVRDDGVFESGLDDLGRRQEAR